MICLSVGHAALAASKEKWFSCVAKDEESEQQLTKKKRVYKI